MDILLKEARGRGKRQEVSEVSEVGGLFFEWKSRWCQWVDR